MVGTKPLVSSNRRRVDNWRRSVRGLARAAGLMLALLGIAGSAISSLFSVASGGLLSIFKTVALGLGIRFYLGLVVGLFITDSKVRGAVLELGKDVVGAVVSAVPL